MSLPTFGAFLLALLAIIILASIAWIIFVHLRARRLGLPTPTLSSYNPFASRTSYTPQPRTGGLIGWISDKYRSFRSRRSRTAGGAYEEPLGAYGAGGGGARSGFGALDPDEAWDARVGNEADYYREEQEVGLNADTGYSGVGAEERGRTRGRRGEEGPYGVDSQRELDRRYEEEMAGQGQGVVVTKSGGSQSRNPFDDSAAVGTSLRGVSPRPDMSAGRDGEHEGFGGDPDSPTGKRSSFKEVM